MSETPATRLLENSFVVLQEYELTMRQFLDQLFMLLGVAACAWFLLVATLAIFWPQAFEWLFQPIPVLVIYALLCADAWRKIGMRRVTVDLQKRVWVTEKHMRSDRSGMQCEEIPFRNLLLIRHWQAEDECRAAAFILRLQVSKIVWRPDCAGYIMHIVYAGYDAMKADLESSAVAARLCQRTSIEYLDICNSPEERFAPWSNRAIEQTSTGKPEAVAHVDSPFEKKH
jgi:hypothetical protein